MDTPQHMRNRLELNYFAKYLTLYAKRTVSANISSLNIHLCPGRASVGAQQFSEIPTFDHENVKSRLKCIYKWIFSKMHHNQCTAKMNKQTCES